MRYEDHFPAEAAWLRRRAAERRRREIDRQLFELYGQWEGDTLLKRHPSRGRPRFAGDL